MSHVRQARSSLSQLTGQCKYSLSQLTGQCKYSLSQLTSHWKFYPLSMRILPFIFIIFLLVPLIFNIPKRSKREVKPREVLNHNEAAPQVEVLAIDDQVQQLLSKAFRGADFDGNGFLTDAELEIAIHAKISEHIKIAMKNNYLRFMKLDKKPKNGQVDWDEYFEFFLSERFGLSTEEIESINNNNTTPRNIKESISMLKAAWSEAARGKPESLNIDEFLSLEHPESSMFTRISDVEALLIKKDKDGDGKLSLAEYSSHIFQDLNAEEKQELEEEFKSVDVDASGIAERKELVKFLDPKNRYWSKKDAKKIKIEG